MLPVKSLFLLSLLICNCDIISTRVFLTSLSPAGVAEVPPYAPFEEALAALAGEHAVVFPARLVPTHPAVHHARLVLVRHVHVAAAGLRRPVLLLSPQVSLLPESVSVPVRVAPSPAHHGHIHTDTHSVLKAAHTHTETNSQLRNVARKSTQPKQKA